MFKIHMIGRLMFESADLGGGAGGTGGGEPADMSSVVAGAIADGGGGEPVVPDPTEPKPDEAEEKELAAIEQEIRTKNPAMRGNIAIHRHQAVLTRQRNAEAKARAEWDAKAKQWSEAEARYKQETEGWRQYEWAKDPEIQNALKAIALADTDEKEFVNRLLQDERYAKLIQLRDQKAGMTGDRPKPNQKNGEFEYYDDDGISQLLEWHGAQVSKTSEERILKAVEAKYGPLAEAYQASTTWNSALAEQKAVLEDMRANWEGFKEHEPAIKAAMMKREEERKSDSRLKALPAQEAYRLVVIPALIKEREELKGKQALDEGKLREKWIAEMKAKPGAAATLKPSGGVEREASSGDRSLEDVVRASLPRE